MFEAFQKEFVDILVPLGEFGADFVQEWADLVFRERHDSGDDPADPLGFSGGERPQKNAGLVGLENRGRAFDVDRIQRLSQPMTPSESQSSHSSNIAATAHSSNIAATACDGHRITTDWNARIFLRSCRRSMDAGKVTSLLCPANTSCPARGFFVTPRTPSTKRNTFLVRLSSDICHTAEFDLREARSRTRFPAQWEWLSNNWMIGQPAPKAVCLCKPDIAPDEK